VHFIALGGSVEELDRVAVLMARLFPTDKGRYEKIAREAMEHAEVERASFAARPTGLLW
jgi:hypothetical protein